MGHSSGLCSGGHDCLENGHPGRPLWYISSWKNGQQSIRTFHSLLPGRSSAGPGRDPDWKCLTAAQVFNTSSLWEPSTEYLLSPPPKHLTVPATRFGLLQGCGLCHLGFYKIRKYLLEHICNRLPCHHVLFMWLMFLIHNSPSEHVARSWPEDVNEEAYFQVRIPEMISTHNSLCCPKLLLDPIPHTDVNPENHILAVPTIYLCASF